MATFVEVDSIEKACKVIINLDLVAEFAPLREGGTAIFFLDSAGVGARSSMKVKDSYDQFKQFAMQTVSSEDIAKKIASLKPSKPVDEVKESKEEKLNTVKIPSFAKTKTTTTE
jgi:hypothetical protein